MSTKKATVYRMVMPDHLCPYGLKTVDLLKREGFEVEDHHLTTREETDAFKQKHGVKTTPQTFIDGKRIGGYDDLREHFVTDCAKGLQLTKVLQALVSALQYLFACTFPSRAIFACMHNAGPTK